MRGSNSIQSCQCQREGIDTLLVHKLTCRHEDTTEEVETTSRVEPAKAWGLVGRPFRVARQARSWSA